MYLSRVPLSWDSSEADLGVVAVTTWDAAWVTKLSAGFPHPKNPRWSAKGRCKEKRLSTRQLPWQVSELCGVFLVVSELPGRQSFCCVVESNGWLVTGPAVYKDLS